MGWETRKGSGRYFTRSRRENGRVVREYFGTGLVAELEAAEMLAEREDLALQAEQLRAQKECDRILEQSLSTLEDSIDALMKGTLLVHGFYQHNRGEWRKRK